MNATEVSKLQDNITAPLEQQIVVLQRIVKTQAELLNRIEYIVKSRVHLTVWMYTSYSKLSMPTLTEPSEECDWCHDLFYPHDLTLLDGEGFVCMKCLAQYLENGK